MKLISLISAFLFCCCCCLIRVKKAELIINNYSNKDSGLRAIVFQIPCLRWHHSGRCIRHGYSQSDHKLLKEKVMEIEFKDLKKKFKKS